MYDQVDKSRVEAWHYSKQIRLEFEPGFETAWIAIPSMEVMGE